MFRSTVLLLIYCLVTSAFEFQPHNISEVDNSTLSTNNCTPEECLQSYVSGFLVRLSASIDDDKVPTYLSNLIVNEPSKLNITSNDILSLYGINVINITKTETILKYLNITPSTVFSLEGFEGFLNELMIDFFSFYTDVVAEMDIDPADHLAFLASLNVDLMNFPYALQFGDPFAEFKKGNLSNESFINAVQSARRTTDEVFEHCRNQFIKKISLKLPEENFIILEKYGIDKSKFLNLWNVLNVSNQRPYEIDVFHNIIRNVERESNENSPLAILIANNQVITNKAVMELFQRKPITINVVVNSTSQPVTGIFNSSWPNIVTVNLANKELFGNNSHAVLANDMGDLRNCTLFSYDANWTLLSESIPYVQNHGSLLKLNSTTFQKSITLGSPLVCNSRVYGIARSFKSGEIVLDAFASLQISDGNSTSNIDTTTSTSSIASGTVNILGNYCLVFLTVLNVIILQKV